MSSRASAFFGDLVSPQVAALAEAKIDLAVALTMTNVNEAVGVVRAAAECRIPIAVSPTLETDGRLPDGTALGDFIRRVDEATGACPFFHRVNCVHPVHVEPTIQAAAEQGAAWLARLRGVRANASQKSHAELDNSTELDRGDLHDLARRMAALKRAYGLTVLGGCCGTDADHIRVISDACAASP